MEVRAELRLTEVGEIPTDWDTDRLGNLVDPKRSIRYGIVQPGRFDPDGRYMIRGQDYSKGWVDPTELFRVSSAIEIPFEKARVITGDVLITIVGASTGHIAVVPDWLDGANLTQTTARIAPTTVRLNGDFCSYVLASAVGERQVANYLKGAAQPGLNCGDIEKFVIPLPALNEQLAIAAALSDMDALLAGLDRLIAKKRDLKQAAMQQLLTSQTRLPGFQGEWETRPVASVVADLESGVSVNSVAGASDAGSDESGILKTSCIADGTFDPTEYKLIDPRDLGRAKLNPRRNSLIISRMNTPNLVGEVGFVKHDYPELFLPDRLWMTRFRPDSGVCPKWLAYVLSSPAVKRAIKDLASGTSGSMKNIAKGKLLALPLAFPAPPEQEAIAAILSDMDAELTALEARRDKTRALKQGMMQELLTGRTRLV